MNAMKSHRQHMSSRRMTETKQGKTKGTDHGTIVELGQGFLQVCKRFCEMHSLSECESATLLAEILESPTLHKGVRIGFGLCTFRAAVVMGFREKQNQALRPQLVTGSAASGTTASTTKVSWD